MRMILSEYSLAVMYVIVVLSVISILFFALNNNDTGFVVTYNTNMVYANEFFAGTDGAGTTLSEHEASGRLDSLDAVHNTTTTIRKPAFMLSSSIVNDDYIFNVPTLGGSDSKTYYTYDEVLSLFSANGKISLNKWDGSGYIDVGLPNEVEIVITKLSPTTRGVDGSLATEWVESTDKFGNVIHDSNGDPIMIEKVVYQEESFSRDNISEFYIDWDVACRYRVLYRYTDGTIKSEYSAMFANKIRSATEIYEEVYTEWVDSE